MDNNLTQTGLDNMISLLKKKLPGMTFRTFEGGVVCSEYTIHDIQLMAARMAKHLALIGYTPVVTYEPLTDAAGNINLNDSMEVYINIDSRQKYRWSQVKCILAHEMCHKFLYTHFVRYEGLKNEFLTDCCAVFTGFGRIMVEGCVTEITQGNTTTTHKIGYLEKRQLNYIHRTLFHESLLNDTRTYGSASGNYKAATYRQTFITPTPEITEDMKHRKPPLKNRLIDWAKNLLIGLMIAIVIAFFVFLINAIIVTLVFNN